MQSMTILKSPFKSPHLGIHLGHFSRLQLPWHLHGPCLSALARRLAAAPLPRALRALRRLGRLGAAQLGRQALNAARRNLMWCLGSGFWMFLGDFPSFAFFVRFFVENGIFGGDYVITSHK